MKCIPEYDTGIGLIDNQQRVILNVIYKMDKLGMGIDRTPAKLILKNMIEYKSRILALNKAYKKKRSISIPYCRNLGIVYI